MSNLQDAIDLFEETAGDCESGKKRLFFSDGAKKFSDEVHAERVKKLSDSIQHVYRTFKPTIEKGIGDITREIDTLEATISAPDLSSMLSADELDTANKRAQFIREDCQNLDLEKLLSRAKVALENGDRAAMMLYARYLPARLDDARQKNAPKRPIMDLDLVVNQIRDAMADKKASERLEALYKRRVELQVLAQEARRRTAAVGGQPDPYKEDIRRRFHVQM